MVHAGIRGLDTPQTNLDDATYISGRHPEFDLSDEQSFEVPPKENNILEYKLQNIRRSRSNLRTPSNLPSLTNRTNLPGLGGGEFTPLLKNATRNSALRNEVRTPAFLKKRSLNSIHENLSPLPTSNTIESASRNYGPFISTPATQLNVSSTVSTPTLQKPSKSEKSHILHDGAQLSLREQEEAIDRIEKENFALKLKIFFLEEALLKAGPEYNEAALKENTELKVDKVTLQKELIRFRKTLHAAERDVELYRQQLIELQEKYKQNQMDDNAREEITELRRTLEDKDNEITGMKHKSVQIDNLQDRIHNLEAEIRRKELSLDDRDDKIEDLRQEATEREEKLHEAEMAISEAQSKIGELEKKSHAFNELKQSKEKIRNLESKISEMTREIERTKNDQQNALRRREQAEADIERLQDEIANKSFSAKSLNRQVEERVNRTQEELEKLREEYSSLHEKYLEKVEESNELNVKFNNLKSKTKTKKHDLKEKIEILIKEKADVVHEKDSISTKFESNLIEFHALIEKSKALEIENDDLGEKLSNLQRDLEASRSKIVEIEETLARERISATQSEQELKDRYQNEVNVLSNKIEDIQAQLERKERMSRDESEKWANDKRSLQAQKDLIEEKALGLQHSIDKLQESEGTLSSKEAKIKQTLKIETDRHNEQEAILNRQINELNEDIKIRQQNLVETQHELTVIMEELRLSQREQKQLEEKVEGLEDEIEVLQTNLDEETEAFNKEITATKKENEELLLQITSIKSDLTKARSMASNVQKETEESHINGERSREQLISLVKNSEEKLNNLRLEKKDLEDQLNKVNLEINSLRASKASLEIENFKIKDQLSSLQDLKEIPKFDQDRMNLKSSKQKLELEVLRLQEENNAANAERENAENQLDIKIIDMQNIEARLNTEIKNLQKKVKSSTDKRELAIAKMKILQLETRINELENHLNGSDSTDEEDNKEFSLIYRSLKESQEKETEYIQREADYKDVIRGLKLKIFELERKVHNTEISRFQNKSLESSPSIGNSKLKEELVELRAQLVSAHKNTKELRTQLKGAERDAQRKIKASNLDLEMRNQNLEAEKHNLGRSLEQVQLAKEELQIRNRTVESTILRLREKIERLEKALQAERLNSGENRTMVLERKDLHDMLRESQSQVEELDLLVRERDQSISNLTAIENELRTQLEILRGERSQLRKKCSSYHAQIEELQSQFGQAKAQWEIDRRNLTRRVRFANLSLSLQDSNNNDNDNYNHVNNNNENYDSNINLDECSIPQISKQQQNNHNLPPKLLKMKSEFDEREKNLVKQMRGVNLQLEWLRAKCQREEHFRAEAAFAKRFMGLQIALFEACNKADIQLLEKCGIKRPPPRPKKPMSLKRIGIVLRAMIRMKRAAERWAEKRKIDEKVRGQVEKQRKHLLHEIASKCSKEPANINTITTTSSSSSTKKRRSKSIVV
ncbi:Spindle pole body protein pcp1 [Erysiphe necator]|nr:Spindle pole body protein pcp1 [Erysiphe necator]